MSDDFRVSPLTVDTVTYCLLAGFAITDCVPDVLAGNAHAEHDLFKLFRRELVERHKRINPM
ncbi:MAG: hypothetical protein ACE5D6_08065 [Candidatus Zixiibacteriota bacterium]